ncbi:MAG: hypothetical protein ACI4K6_04130 [Candidatus Fimenecus sp.]
MRTKEIFKKLIYAPVPLLLLLTVISAAALFAVFYCRADTQPLAYGVYVLSAYTLTADVAAAIRIGKTVNRRLRQNKHIAAYFTRADLRVRISLYCGTAINLAYAVFKLGTGILYRSVWLGSVAIYYILLVRIRFLLIRDDRTVRKHTDTTQISPWKSYRRCGGILLVLNFVISGMVFQMIAQNQGTAYPGYVIYASAAYTFYRLIAAFVKIRKTRKMQNPILSAAKAVDLCIALMALFSLQTAMLTVFGADMPQNTQRWLNIVSGAAVCVLVICIAIYMLLRAKQNINSAALPAQPKKSEEVDYGKTEHI